MLGGATRTTVFLPYKHMYIFDITQRLVATRTRHSFTFTRNLRRTHKFTINLRRRLTAARIFPPLVGDATDGRSECEPCKKCMKRKASACACHCACLKSVHCLPERVCVWFLLVMLRVCHCVSRCVRGCFCVCLWLCLCQRVRARVRVNVSACVCI